jgi:hypothetical protein
MCVLLVSCHFIIEDINLFLRCIQEFRIVVSCISARVVQLDGGSVVDANTVDFFQTQRVICKFRRRQRFIYFFLFNNMCVFIFQGNHYTMLFFHNHSYFWPKTVNQQLCGP